MKKIIIFILALTLMSCYYTFETTKLEGVESINIEQINNKTEEYRLNEYLMDELTKVFVNDSSLQVGKKSENTADLNITITEFSEEIVAIDFNENPTSKKIIIRLEYKFTKGEKIIDENKNYLYEYNYAVDSNVDDDFYVKTAVQKLATSLKDQLVEGF